RRIRAAPRAAARPLHAPPPRRFLAAHGRRLSGRHDRSLCPAGVSATFPSVGGLVRYPGYPAGSARRRVLFPHPASPGSSGFLSFGEYAQMIMWILRGCYGVLVVGVAAFVANYYLRRDDAWEAVAAIAVVLAIGGLV